MGDGGSQFLLVHRAVSDDDCLFEHFCIFLQSHVYDSPVIFHGRFRALVAYDTEYEDIAGRCAYGISAVCSSACPGRRTFYHHGHAYQRLGSAAVCDFAFNGNGLGGNVRCHAGHQT